MLHMTPVKRIGLIIAMVAGRIVGGIDVSPEMAKLAAQKFPEVTVICGDVEEVKFDRRFGCVTVYNAFPISPTRKS